jgi:hypothetical protein
VKADQSEWAKEKERMKKDFKANEALKEGVIRDRTCTDIFCLLLFFAFIGAMCFCVFVGYSQGELDKVIAPIDPNQHFCGVKHWKKDKARKPLEERGEPEYDNTGYPYLFFPGLNPDGDKLGLATVLKDSFCVAECPGKEAKQVECASGSKCTDGKVADSYPTRTFVRYCLPRTLGT